LWQNLKQRLHDGRDQSLLTYRLGISNRVIGNIYCITVSAVQHRKLKLKKDVFRETNPDITLEQILTSK
jgi:hypothetical protein